MEKRPGKCESCGLVMPYEKGKGAWKYFCNSDGKSRRGGDSCDGYWEAEDMKKTIDEMTQFV
ncbi:hypothetical protein C808_00569 [Lachnospiraceae bacterium M18-1]|nr:hypothetical protein [uncultured Schaedlerella sp.]EOS41400.1 hypothetical protein C808_00569 [Lachnospiraceae bacterium M18-1]